MIFRLSAPLGFGLGLLVAACSTTSAGTSSGAAPADEAVQVAGQSTDLVDPADFTSTIDNPWFPLKPGTSLTYQGVKDGRTAVRVVAVTTRTKVVDRVTCVVVEDVLSFAGTPTERVLGYYAQDRVGNVWYFGEDAQELNASGKVTKSESWAAGTDGALPSFFMEAAPAVGHAFGHDYTKDHFRVISLSESVTVPYGSFRDVLVTEEWNQMEQDALARKYYARGVGEIRDLAVRGDEEEFRLVKVER